MCVLSDIVCVLSCLVMSDSLRPHGLQPTSPLCPWYSQARILERVAISCSRGSSWPWVGNRISCIAGKFFTNWTTRKALHIHIFLLVWTSFIHIFVNSFIDKYPAPFMPLLWGAFQMPRTGMKQSLLWTTGVSIFYLLYVADVLVPPSHWQAPWRHTETPICF